MNYFPLNQTGFFRSASAFMNLLLTTLKIVAEYYPGRLYKAFVIDPPSLFAYLWKVISNSSFYVISVLITFTIPFFFLILPGSNSISFCRACCKKRL